MPYTNLFFKTDGIVSEQWYQQAHIVFLLHPHKNENIKHKVNLVQQYQYVYNTYVQINIYVIMLSKTPTKKIS